MKLFLFLSLFPASVFANSMFEGSPYQYDCKCVVSIQETPEGCGMVSMVGVATLEDGAEITVRDWYWFGSKKKNSNCYFPTSSAAKKGCAEAIEYRRQQGVCK